MDDFVTAVLSLVGIVIGWLLGQLGGFAGRLAEARRLRGRVILHLLERRREADQLYAILKGAREINRPDRPLSEEHQRMIDTHLGGERPFLRKLQELSEDVAQLDPILAFNLSAQASSLRAMKEQDFGSFGNDPTYQEMAKAFETILASMVRDTDKAALRIGLRFSPIFWLRLRCWLREHKAYRHSEWGSVVRETFPDKVGPAPTDRGDT